MSAPRVVKLLLGICGASVLKGLRFGPEDFLFSSMKSYMAVTMGKVRGIPERSLSSILEDAAYDVLLPAATGFERGSLPALELLALIGVLKANNPEAVLEIGTFMGSTTKSIAQNLPNAVVHTVDLPLGLEAKESATLDRLDAGLIRRREPGREFLGTPFAARIRQHFQDTAKWDFLGAQGATCFFIDANHSYEYCKNDSERCFELCKGRGVFLWHDCDYFTPGVVRLIKEWRAMGRDVVRITDTSIAYWKSY